MKMHESSDRDGDADRIRLDWSILAVGLKGKCSCAAA